MLSIIAALLDAVRWVGQYFAQQQLINAGKAEEQVAVQKEVEVHVAEAERAVAVPDAPRTERLRKRFDQAYGNE